MKMKRVFLYLGMGSCVSSPNKSVVEPTTPTKFSDDHDHHTLEKVLNSAQSPVWEPQGSKEEAFFDSKPWFDSDDESDFFSVNGDFPPYKLTSNDNNNGDRQGKKLLDLFKESSSFSSDSQRSVIAARVGKEREDYYHTPTTPLTPSNNNNKLEKGKSGKSAKQHCLPSLVRSLSSCGERKKRQSPAHHMAVVAG